MNGPLPVCRCGWDGTGNHPCHRCGKAPGTRRFRHADVPYSLAGAQPKFNMVETYSCDPCWDEWQALIKNRDPAELWKQKNDET